MNYTSAIHTVDTFTRQAVPVLQRLWQIIRSCFSAFTDNALCAEATDETLMRAYCNGQQQAYRWLFDRYAPKLHRAALRRGLSNADAHDAVQQAFIHVHQSRAEFRDGAAVRPWIYTIAFNVMRDYGRHLTSQKRIREAYAIEVQSAPQMEEEPTQSIGRSRLREAIDKLSPVQRDVLLLHYFEELSFVEIARLLGTREGAIRVRAHRGYQKLRRILKGAEFAERVA